MSSIWRRRRKFLAFSMLRKTFPKGKLTFWSALLKIFACGAPKHCICTSNAQWNTMRNVSNPTRTYAPTLQVGEEDGLKLKKRDLSISPIRKGGGKNHRFSRFLNLVPCHDGGGGGVGRGQEGLNSFNQFF